MEVCKNKILLSEMRLRKNRRSNIHSLGSDVGVGASGPITNPGQVTMRVDLQNALGRVQVIEVCNWRTCFKFPVLCGAALHIREDSASKAAHRCEENGTVVVDRWIRDVQWNAFRGIVKVCRDGELVKEDIPV